MMREKNPLGDQEWEALRFISDRGAPVTVREVAQEWGEPNGLARTTILTMMERLRKKNFLLREQAENESVFRYRPAVAKADLMRNMVAQFVQKTLGGSVAPFVAYLADADAPLSEGERDELRRLVEALDGETSDEDAK